MKSERQSSGFLRRPFWRDWVLSYLLIGVGFMLGDFAYRHDTQARIMVAVGMVMLFAGLLVFLAAIIHAIWFVVRRTRRPPKPPPSP